MSTPAGTCISGIGNVQSAFPMHQPYVRLRSLTLSCAQMSGESKRTQYTYSNPCHPAIFEIAFRVQGAEKRVRREEAPAKIKVRNHPHLHRDLPVCMNLNLGHIPLKCAGMDGPSKKGRLPGVRSTARPLRQMGATQWV